MRDRSFLAGAALLCATAVSSAHANTINIYNDSLAGGAIAQLTDKTNAITFLGFIGDGSTSSTQAFTFDLPNYNPGTETTFLSSIANQTVIFESKMDNIDAETYSFAADTGFFALKLGAGIAYFQNQVAPGSLSLSFTATGRQAGLSHATLFSGTPTPVPGPVAGAGIPALMALAGFVWARRREVAVAA